MNRELTPRSVATPLGHRLGMRTFAACLFLLSFLMFPDVFLGRGTFFFRDFSIFGFSWASFHRATFWDGHFPFWNPLNNCGIPFMAQWSTMSMYPFSLIYLVFPPSVSLGLFCIFHMWLAGLGMFALVNRWLKNPWAAAFAGMAFAFSGLLLNSLTWPCNIAAFAWMPCLVLLSEDFRKGIGAKRFLTPVVGTFQMLAGAPEITLLTWVIIFALWLERWISEKQIRKEIALRFFALTTLVAGFSAVQLFPFFDFLAHSQRDRHFGEDELWAMPLSGAANFFVPLFHTFSWGSGIHFQLEQYWTTSYYVGISTVVLALMGLRRIKGRWLALAILAGLGLILAMGEKAVVYDWLLKACPPLGFMRYPIKFVVLPVFILPLLAGFTLSNAGQNPNRRFYFVGIAIGLSAIATIVTIERFHPLKGIPASAWLKTMENGQSRALLLIVFFGALWGMTRFQRPQSQLILAGSALLSLWLDLIGHMPDQNPTVPPARYGAIDRGWRTIPQPGASRAMPSRFSESAMHSTALPKPSEDFLQKRGGIYGNLNLIEGFPKVGGLSSLHFPQMVKFENSLYSTELPPAGLLDFLSVQYFSAPNEITKWIERTNFMGWVSGGQIPVFADDEAALKLMQSADFDPRSTIILPPEASNSFSHIRRGTANVQLKQFANESITLEVACDQETLVVVAQSYYHCWKPYVDGKAVTLLRANVAFQAAAIPTGRHTLEFRYVDMAFRIGLGISLFTFLLFGLWMASELFAMRRERKRVTSVQ